MTDWKSIGEITAIIALGIWQGRGKWQERKMMKTAGLKPNPTRCAEHAEAINELKADVKKIKEHLDIV